MNNYKEKIYDMLCGFALLFTSRPSKEQLQAYTERLSNYSPEDLLKAITKLEKTSRHFPALADFYEIIDPSMSEKDEANELAGEIIKCISILGRSAPNCVKSQIGEVGWFVIQRIGGWDSICSTKTDDLGTLRAQLRDLSRMALKVELSGAHRLQMDYQERKASGNQLEKLNPVKMVE